MKIKCINDCEGDFSCITLGKEYEVIEYNPEFIMFVSNGVNVTEPRYTIEDDTQDTYQYPANCFEVVQTETEIKLTDAEEYILRLQDAIEQLVDFMMSQGYYKGENIARLDEYLFLAYRSKGLVN